MSLNRIVAECIRDAAQTANVHVSNAEGVSGVGMWNHYVEAQRLLAAGSSFSTISLPGILSNIANKSLLSAYEEVPRVFRKIARKVSCTDFKPGFGYRLVLEGGRMQKIPTTGKIPSTTVAEEAYQRGIETKGTLLTLTRAMIINDDLNAFSQIPELFGRLSADTIEEDGFDLLKSNQSLLFKTGNKNLVSKNKALGPSGLGEAIKMLNEQTDSNNRPINVAGKYLLIPPALEAEAWTLLNSQYVVSNPNQIEKIGDKNRYYGLYDIVMSPYLSSIHGKDVSKGSDVAWYFLAAPTSVALFCISYLDGREQPIIESETAAFDVLGVQFRIYHDCGINIEDYRAGVYSAGA